MNKAVRELIRALEKVQDLDGTYVGACIEDTYVGACIEELEKQRHMKPNDPIILMRPIPITERLPKPYDPNCTKPQDCDPMGRCWTGSATLMVSNVNDEDVPYPPFWELRGPLNADTHWLPHWALPLPEVES